MPRTKNDLATSALEKLNAIGVGQSASAEDMSIMYRVIDTKVDELNERRAAWIPDTDVIDDAVFEALSIIIASAAAPAFGQAPNPDSEARAETRLREMGGVQPSFPAKVCYF